MKQDRFLTGILVGIGLLVVVALAVFFSRRDTQTYISEDAPEGVVHNYVLAVLDKDYEKAYGYLAELEYKPTYEEFRRAFLNGEVNPDNQAVDIGASDIEDDIATVELELIYNSSDPFSTGYRNMMTADLVRQGGAWKLTLMPQYNFWGYNWYVEPPQ
jgi:hypothetical protein